MGVYLREASLLEGLQGPVNSRIMRDVHIYVWTPELRGAVGVLLFPLYPIPMRAQLSLNRE